MKKNVGYIDAVLRSIAGTAAVMLHITGMAAGVWGWVLLGVGTVLIITAFTGFCPLWALLGINTAKEK